MEWLGLVLGALGASLPETAAVVSPERREPRGGLCANHSNQTKSCQVTPRPTDWMLLDVWRLQWCNGMAWINPWCPWSLDPETAAVVSLREESAAVVSVPTTARPAESLSYQQIG